MPGAGVALTLSVFILNLGYLVLEQQFRKNNAALRSANSIIYESLEFLQDSSETEIMASIRELQQVLSDTIREWQGKYEQIDDMVVVGIRI